MTPQIESKIDLYHSPQESGFWTDLDVFNRDISLKNGKTLSEVIPVGVREENGDLVMVFSTFEGDLTELIGNIPGLEVVEGNSAENPHEKDGEPLVQINYLKVGAMEVKPRRIRPTTIKFGIHGDTEQVSAERGSSHRAMGESADFYLEGHDTQYDPGEDGNADIRRFPLWRIGVWGDQQQMADVFLPKPQGAPKA